MATLKNKNNHLKACSTYTDNENHFLVDSRYEIVRVLGKGSYGVVCSAIDTKSSVSAMEHKIAIKKVTKIFNKDILLIRAIRELKFMMFSEATRMYVHETLNFATLFCVSFY